MKCPFCDTIEDKVLESREVDEGSVVRRRRECLSCRGRFTSYERIEERPIMVIKWKEIFERLEKATDRCEEVANIIEKIVIDNREQYGRLRRFVAAASSTTPNCFRRVRQC